MINTCINVSMGLSSAMIAKITYILICSSNASQVNMEKTLLSSVMHTFKINIENLFLEIFWKRSTLVMITISSKRNSPVSAFNWQIYPYD